MHYLIPSLIFILFVINNRGSSVKSQDIIFGDSDEDDTVPLNGYSPHGEEEDGVPVETFRRHKFKDDDCVPVTRKCVTLDKCPSLFLRLRNPTPSNLMMLRNASCGFTTVGDPLVWCENRRCIYSSHHSQLTDTRRHEPTPSSNNNNVNPLSLTFEETDGNIGNSLIKDVEDSGLNSEECGTALPGRISGGEGAARGEFPWAVAISVHTKNGPQIVCGGALLTEQFVITAAHCVADASYRVRNVSHVRIGAHNISKQNENGAENVAVTGIYFHEDFRERPVVKNDIAILKLGHQVIFGSTIGSICVPKKNDSLTRLYAPSSIGTIVGWGSDGVEPKYNILQKAKIPIVSGDVCRRRFRRIRVNVIPELQVCAGEKGRDSCKGDSGGPLSIERNNRHILIGIISFGTVQCDGRLPGVYTKISSYMKWIENTIAKNR